MAFYQINIRVFCFSICCLLKTTVDFLFYCQNTKNTYSLAMLIGHVNIYLFCMYQSYMMFKDLTQHELLWLKHRYNLSDGHCHQWQSDEQKKIIEKLPQLRYEAESLKQHQLDELFIDTFFTHQGLRAALQTPSMLVYSSSIAITITANYMMKKWLSATLITPCFDNLPDIFKSFNIPLEPIAEKYFHSVENIYKNLVDRCTSDALFLIDINNPTGFSLLKLGQEAWEEIIRYCKDYNKLLIIDFCFAPLLNFDQEYQSFDIYKLLIDAGVRYIAYEDTGKVWPVQDAKVSILKASMDIYADLYDIKTAYLLNVSPFILRFLIEYLRVSEKTNYDAIQSIIETNKKHVNTYTQWTILEQQKSKTPITVSRNKITDSNVKATDLQKYLAESGVYVLPWTFFFWDDHSMWERYIRIALARDSRIFEQSMINLRKWLLKYSSNKQ